MGIKYLTHLIFLYLITLDANIWLKVEIMKLVVELPPWQKKRMHSLRLECEELLFIIRLLFSDHESTADIM
jgi:hypothetical protein